MKFLRKQSGYQPRGLVSIVEVGEDSQTEVIVTFINRYTEEEEYRFGADYESLKKIVEEK